MSLLIKNGRIIVLFTLLLFQNCKVKTHSAASSNDPVPAEIKEDSLRNKNDYHYLSDLPTSKIAELFLADSIQPSDNEITYRCIDSLKSRSAATRSYYFTIFNKILRNADGALAEEMSVKSKEYVESFPKEFAGSIGKLSDNDLKKWAESIAEEFFH